jgi:hypothetical protein
MFVLTAHFVAVVLTTVHEQMRFLLNGSFLYFVFQSLPPLSSVAPPAGDSFAGRGERTEKVFATLRTQDWPFVEVRAVVEVFVGVVSPVLTLLFGLVHCMTATNNAALV